MGFVKLVLLGYAALTVIYFSISVYARSVRRENLEEDWDAENDSRKGEDRDAFIDQGMAEYERSIRRRLIWLVYVLPSVAVIGILVLNNAN